MKRIARSFAAVVLPCCALLWTVPVAGRAADVTFARDVAPLFQKHCQTCHRPGETAPMSLLSFEDARPWAKKIREVVARRIMPPWHADPSVGHFSNDRRMTQEGIDTIVAWVDRGAKLGDPADLPPPLQFTEGWAIGPPDMVFEMQEESRLSAGLTDDYRYIRIPTGLTRDRWISAIECRPGNLEVVHHALAFLQLSGSDQLESGIGGYAPGVRARPSQEDGIAQLLPAGSTIVLQMHYHKEAGFAATDRTSVGVRFARGVVRKRARGGAVSDVKFVIPAGDPNYEVVAKQWLKEPIRLTSVSPHMHLRGKDMRVWAELPGGTVKDILWVPNYDFNWQTAYQLAEPMLLPKGTKLVAKAHYDNSVNNASNPNPDIDVRYGLPTYAEMMYAFYGYTIDSEDLDTADPVYGGERQTQAVVFDKTRDVASMRAAKTQSPDIP